VTASGDTPAQRAPAAGAEVVPRPRPSAGAIAIGVLNGVLTVLYPVAIWLGLTRLGARATGVMVLGLLVPLVAFRLRKADRTTFWSVLRVPIAILCLVVLGIVTGDARFVLALPVLISAVLLVTFGATLRAGATPMIERFARITEPDLPPDKQAHCRRWTVRWCVFFVINGVIAAALGLWASPFVWASYTGGLAYALMGVLFSVEYVERRARFRDFGDGLLDRLLRRALPPRPGPT
jgi:uncharacterized membrane protein